MAQPRTAKKAAESQDPVDILSTGSYLVLTFLEFPMSTPGPLNGLLIQLDLQALSDPLEP